MSIEAPARPVTADALLERPHVHTRACWWDVTQCRWAGPAHPAPPPRTVSPPR